MAAGDILIATGENANPNMEYLDILRDAGLNPIRHPRSGPATADWFRDAVTTIEPEAILAGGEKGVFLAEIIAEAAELSLKKIARTGVGFDGIDVPQAKSNGVFTSITPVLADAVAETGMALLLDGLQRLYGMIADARAGRWKPLIGERLAGADLGVIGAGDVGHELIQRLIPHNCNIHVYDPFWKQASWYGEQCSIYQTAIETRNSSISTIRRLKGYPSAEANGTFTHWEEASATGHENTRLYEMLSQCDAVIICAALTEGTEGMINKQFLESLGTRRSRGSIPVLVNIARGEFVFNEFELSQLCHNDQLIYATDVTRNEPNVKECPLRTAPNVIISPHIASAKYGTRRMMYNTAAWNIVHHLAGEYGQVFRYVKGGSPIE